MSAATLEPCPFCGKSGAAKMTTGAELMDEDQEFWRHSESFAVICDASSPNGPGGCGAVGGFALTEASAIALWNRRTPASPAAAPANEVARLVSELRGWAAELRTGQALSEAADLLERLAAPAGVLGEVPAPCREERECEWSPWCRNRSQCLKPSWGATAGVKAEPAIPVAMRKLLKEAEVSLSAFVTDEHTTLKRLRDVLAAQPEHPAGERT